MKLVELLGIPGSGKTTSVRTVCEALRAQAIRPMLTPEILRLGLAREWNHYPGVVLRVLPRPFGRRLARSHLVVDSRRMKGMIYHHPLFSVLERHLVLAASARSFSGEELQKVRHWLYQLVGVYALIERSRHPQETLVLEEGFSLRAITLFAYGTGDVDTARTQAYLEQIPAPDIVYYLEVMPETALRRIRSRGWIPSRLLGKDEEGILVFLRRAAEVAELTVKVLAKRGTRIIRIDAERDVPAVEELITVNTRRLVSPIVTVPV